MGGWGRRGGFWGRKFWLGSGGPTIYGKAGNVGIGTTSPQASLDDAGGLHVRGTQYATSGSVVEIQKINSTLGTISMISDGSTRAFGEMRMYGSSIGLWPGGAAAVTAISNGNVGIGTASPGQKLTIDGSAPIAEIRTGGYLMLRPTANDWDMRLQAVGTRLDVLSGGNLGTPIMSLLNGGFVGIGTASPNAALAVWGSTSWTPLEIHNNINAQGGNDCTSGGCRQIEMYGNGTWMGEVYVQNGAAYYGNGSDYRLKENIRPVTDALERVLQLRPYSFNYKSAPGGQRMEGFLAHEAQAVIPYAVGGKKDAVDAQGKPIYQTVDYSKLTPILTAAIQELKSLFDGDHGELMKLKAANDNLRKEFEAYKAAHQ